MEEFPHADGVYGALEKMISGKTMDSSSVVLIIPHAIRVIEKLAKTSTGEYKADLCVHVLTRLITAHGVDEETRSAILVVARPLITTLINVARGHVDIGKAVKRCCT